MAAEHRPGLSVPAYVVFTDNTLIAIAESLPTDDAALVAIQASRAQARAVRCRRPGTGARPAVKSLSRYPVHAPRCLAARAPDIRRSSSARRAPPAGQRLAAPLGGAGYRRSAARASPPAADEQRHQRGVGLATGTGQPTISKYTANTGSAARRRQRRPPAAAGPRPAARRGLAEERRARWSATVRPARRPRR